MPLQFIDSKEFLKFSRDAIRRSLKDATVEKIAYKGLLSNTCMKSVSVGSIVDLFPVLRQLLRYLSHLLHREETRTYEAVAWVRRRRNPLIGKILADLAVSVR